LRIVESLGPDDLCIALISGGGSALLPAPIDGISLADKLAVTQFLSAAGADIAELNTVRKQLSRVKGGGLLRACRAGRMVALVISDIPGDPLELIASGPTVPDHSTPQDALAILEKYTAGSGGHPTGQLSFAQGDGSEAGDEADRPTTGSVDDGTHGAGVPAAVFNVLQHHSATKQVRLPPTCRVSNVVIGNNAIAVDAAGQEAERLGYMHALNCASAPEGAVEPIGVHLAAMAAHMLATSGPNCLISGGEGTVKLAPLAERGRGGCNQQTVLAALVELSRKFDGTESPGDLVILSGGTDGEDGPTDAAGAFVDWAVIEEATRLGLDPIDYLRRNDAYHYFGPLEALIKTGPTHTNVCDVRVVLVERASE
jgi:glycerate-2-kinase